jgi:hemolysin activation/secretion protein
MVIDSLLLAQAQLEPKFQPGPARIPQQIPIVAPERPNSEDESLEGIPADSIDSETDQERKTSQSRIQRYRKQTFQLQGNTIYGDRTIRKFVQTCTQAPSTLSPEDWAALCITLQYQKNGYINTRVFTSESESGVSLDVSEGRLTELRVNGPNEILNRRIKEKLSRLKTQVLNANEVLWALQLLRRQPGTKDISGRLGRIGSDATQSSLIVNTEPQGAQFNALLTYDNEGKISAGEHRNQAIATGESLLELTDRWLVYADQTWSGGPEIGSINYSLSYTKPLGIKTEATASLGFGRFKPIELEGVAKNFRTNQFQAIGIVKRKLIDSYDHDVSIFGQFSFLRSNLYLNDKELPSVVPNLIRKPQSGYIRLGLEANKINRGAVSSAMLYAVQAVAGSTPEDQLGTLKDIGITPEQSNAVGAAINNVFLFKNGMQLRLSLAGQKAFGPLVTSMLFQLGANSGLIGLPSTVLSGENGLQATTELLVPLGSINQWPIALKPFYGYGVVSSQEGESRSISSFGTMLSLTNPSRKLSFDVGWTGNVSSQPLIERSWQSWSLAEGLITRATLSF